jgi:hypothetical protein
MPGRGPAPKSKETRVNRAKPQRGEWITLAGEPFKGPKPTLPRVHGGLLESTKKTWADWWSSPMAHQWHKADWPVLTQLIVMTDRVTRALNTGDFFTGFASMVTEARYLRDQLGLTEKGRRDLRWSLPDGMAESEDLPASVTSLTERRRKLATD